MTEEKKKLGEPEYPDEETREIEEEIEKEEKEKTESEEETKVEEESEEEEKKGSEDKRKEEEDKKEEEEPDRTSKINKRSIRSVPYGRFAKAEKKVEKLKTELEGLKKSKDEEKAGGEKVDMQEAFKEIGESLSVEPSVVEKMYNTFTKLGGKKEEIKPEILKKIEEIDATKQQLEWQYEDRQFVKEFKRDILPVLKERYPDISRQQIVKAMRKLHTIAFGEEWHLVPRLKSVFLGVPDEFFFLEGKKGGEGGKSAGMAKKGRKDFTRELSEEEIDQLTDEEFDKYTDKMAELKSGSKFRVIHIPKPR